MEKTNQKQAYKVPEAEAVTLETADIITQSNLGEWDPQMIDE